MYLWSNNPLFSMPNNYLWTFGNHKWKVHLDQQILNKIWNKNPQFGWVKNTFFDENYNEIIHNWEIHDIFVDIFRSHREIQNLHSSKFSKRNYIFPLPSQKLVTYFGQISPQISLFLFIRRVRIGRNGLNN